MKKNTILIISGIVVLLVIGGAYYYENYIGSKNAEIKYPQAVELLKEDPKKALEYCDRNATIDPFDPGADCLAEVLCKADEIGKLRELCEVGTLQYPPQNESEKQKLIDDCVEITKTACKNPREALNLCKDTECFNAVSAISAARNNMEIAKEACQRINTSKEDCYNNLVYSLAKMNKTPEELLKICDLYDKEDFSSYVTCDNSFGEQGWITKKCSDEFIKGEKYNTKYNCYILVAQLTSKRDINAARDVCNKIPVEGIDYKQDCLNNCIKNNQTEEQCNEMCKNVFKNKKDECLSLIFEK